MRTAHEGKVARQRSFRVVLVGTGTEVGKTHVACALLRCWARRGIVVVGLKPVETGVDDGGAVGLSVKLGSGTIPGRSVAAASRLTTSAQRLVEGGRQDRSDQERLSEAAQMFHVKRSAGRGSPQRLTPTHPRRSLYAFPQPVSPHLAARIAGVRIDVGLIERWVADHRAPVAIIETAGGLFSPLGHGSTNFDLMQALRPDAVVLVAPDRLGVLHELTATLALAAARTAPPLAVVLSAPRKKDASTGHNAAELAALGITRPVSVFPRANGDSAATSEASERVIDWVVARAEVAQAARAVRASERP